MSRGQRWLKRKIFVLPGTHVAFKISYREARDLRRILHRSDLPVEQIKLATPMLARCLVQRQIMYSHIFFAVTIIMMIVWIFLPTMAVLNLLVNYRDSEFPIAMLSAAVSPMASIGAFIAIRYDDDYRRIIKYSTGFQHFVSKYAWIFLFAVGLWNSFMTWKIFSDENTRIHFSIPMYGLLIVIGQSLLSMSYLILVYRLGRMILRRRAPELALVRALADAFEIVADATPAKWRAIALRSKVAQHINAAATTLEGPIARRFLASAGFLDAAAIQRRLHMAGSALRSKVGWLATPMAETRRFLARALADALFITAGGNLDQLEYAEMEQAETTTANWVARLRAKVSWAVFGFGPAIFLIISKKEGWITDPATTAILVQFAALCFFVAVLSAVDPSGYKDRLSNVTGTGAALFGWKKPETKDARD